MTTQKSSFSLHPVFQSGMILQRQKPLRVFGHAPAGAQVTARLTRRAPGEQSLTCEASAAAGEDGAFCCTLPPQEASEHAALSVSCDAPGASPVVLSPVWIGEVWLAGGQSNMEFFLRYDADWERVRTAPANPRIRLYNVPQRAFPGHRREIPGYGRWLSDGEAGFETFSAPGYAFARFLQPRLGVPVGVIGCNWGGTSASTWLDETLLCQEPLRVYLDEYKAALAQFSLGELKRRSLSGWAFEDSPLHQDAFQPLLYGRSRSFQLAYMKTHRQEPLIPLGPWHINRPGGLYRQMLHPLAPLALRGVLWYQGESDACHADCYDLLLRALISCLRRDFESELPFLMVQLAPFGVWLEWDAKGYAAVREKQEQVCRSVPGTGLVCTMDIGAYYDIHPKRKMEVGRRLALLARGMVYGETLLCRSPSLSRAVRSGDTIRLSFQDAAGLHGIPPYGLTRPVPDPKPAAPVFSLRQEGRDVPIASVSPERDGLILRAPALSPAPCRLDFARADYAEVRLWNEAGLPVFPFSCTLAEEAAQ